MPVQPAPSIGFSGGMALTAVTILLIWLGIGPEPLLVLLRGIAG